MLNKQFNKKNISSFLAMFLLFLWGLTLYYKSLPALWNAWQSHEYGHGLLLPFISILLTISAETLDANIEKAINIFKILPI